MEMKKKYIAPQTAIMKADTESIMLQGSIRIGSYKDAKSKEYQVIHGNYGFSDKGIQYWVSNDQPETAKDNNGGSLWEDEY